MLDYVKTPVDCGILVCRENLDVLEDALARADAGARMFLLPVSVLAARLRAAADWCLGDFSLLVARTWFVRPDLDVRPCNRKASFTAAECRFSDGGFKLIRAGRVFQRANRLPPVSCIRDRRSGERPLRFEDALAVPPPSFF